MPDRVTGVAGAVRRVLRQMVRRGLRGVWRRGELPAGPFVWAASHHGWWDPFLAMVLLDAHGRAPSLLMRQDNLDRFAFARRAGVFGTHELRRGLRFLADGRTLIVFPEGELRPPGPLGDLLPGAAWYARKAGVPLVAVAVRTLMRGHEAPEAYVSCAVVDTTGAPAGITRRIGESIGAQLADIDALTDATDPRQPLPGFDPVFTGRRSWDERIDTMAGWRPWRG